MVEYVPSENEELINNIFDRINRNVSRLTPQELRHAKFSGRFITKCERLTEFLQAELPRFPNIQSSSVRQMKDVEFTATLLLFIEQGEKSLSALRLLTLSNVVNEAELRRGDFSKLDDACNYLLQELPKKALEVGTGLSLVQLTTGLVIARSGALRNNRLNQYYVYDLAALCQEFPRLKDVAIRTITM